MAKRLEKSARQPMGTFKIRGIIMRLSQWDGLPSISSKIGLLELTLHFWRQVFSLGPARLWKITIEIYWNHSKIMELNLLRHMFTIINQFHCRINHPGPRFRRRQLSPGSPASPVPVGPSTASECSQRSCRADPICCRGWSWPCPCNLGSWWKTGKTQTF